MCNKFRRAAIHFRRMDTAAVKTGRRGTNDAERINQTTALIFIKALPRDVQFHCCSPNLTL